MLEFRVRLKFIVSVIGFELSFCFRVFVVLVVVIESEIVFNEFLVI